MRSLYKYRKGILYLVFLLMTQFFGKSYAQTSQPKNCIMSFLYGNTHPLNKNMRSFDKDNPRAEFTRSGQLLEVALGVQVDSSTTWRLHGNMAVSLSDWAEEQIETFLMPFLLADPSVS